MPALMTPADPLEPGILRAGAACGLCAALIYPLWSAVDLPLPLNRLLHFAFGPLLVVAFLGLDRWVQRQRPSAMARIGCVFGAIAGASFCAMTVVQAANLGWISPRIAETADPLLQQDLRRVLHGVFSVQLGLDIVWDIHICLATILLAASLPGYGVLLRAWRVYGVSAAAATLGLNLLCFPLPPRDAGLVDGGPLVGAWYLGTTLLMIASLRREGRSKPALLGA
jgi:hypothetical protein